MSNNKLYTERELREAIEMAREGIRSEDNIINSLNFVNPSTQSTTSNTKQSNSIGWLFDELEKAGKDWQSNAIDGLQYTGRKYQILELCRSMHNEEQAKISAGWAKLREQTRETAMHIGFARGFNDALMCYEDYYNKLDETNLTEDDFTTDYIVDRFEEIYKVEKDGQ